MTGATIIATLRQNGPLLRRHHVARIGLFGSYIRGEETGSSDVDLLVEFDETAFGANYSGYFNTVTSLSNVLTDLFHQRIDLVTVDMLSPHLAPDVLKEVEFIEE